MSRRKSFVAACVLGAAVAALAMCSGCPPSEHGGDGKDAGGAAPVTPKKTIDPTTTGTVSGTVTFTGTAPAPTMVKVAGDAACTKVHPSEFSADDVKVKDGKVEDAFVWVKTGLDDYAFPPPSGAVHFDQQGCMYHPRLQGARVGQDIEFVNSDPTLHNIASKPTTQAGWNFVTPQGQSGKRNFKKAEVPIRVGCDVHPWMRAYVGVVDHPFFAITKADGSFSFAGLPPGTYTIGAWHEKLGSGEAQVTVAAKQGAAANITLSAAPSTP